MSTNPTAMAVDALAEAAPRDHWFRPIVAGHLTVRLALDETERAAAQALRYRVFYDEMHARPDAAMRAARRDFDAFDPVCDHLLVIDATRNEGAGGQVVGTYRMLRGAVAKAHDGFYTAAEFDISPLDDFAGEVLEVGRSCVDADYRGRPTLELLWRGIAQYVFHYDVALIFGCASLRGTDPAALALPLSYLHHYHLAPPALRPRAVPGRYESMNFMAPERIDAPRVLASLPPLIKGYIRLGGFVGDGAVVDTQFNTTDVCVVVKTDLVTERYARHYERRRDAGPADAAPPMSSPEPTIQWSRALATGRLTAAALWTVALVPIQYVATRLRLPLARRLPRFYHRTTCRLLGIRLEIAGQRSRRRPTLFVANHSSYLDISIYGALIGGSFVAKQEIADWPLFGLLAKLQRSIFVDRTATRDAREQMARIHRRLQSRGNLILFPEGTSSDGNRVLPFKSALLAAAEQPVRGKPLTVQPVAIAYTHLDGIPIGNHLRPMFAWYGDMDLLPHLWQFAGLGRLTVTVTFGAPVSAADFASRKDLTAHLFDAVTASHAAAITGRWPEGLPAPSRRRWLRGRRRRAPRLA